MILNLTDTEAEDRSYIDNEGIHLVKVIEVKEGTFTKNDNPVLKIIFADKDGARIHEDVVITDKALWRIKTITKALKMPNVIDTALMIGRFVKVTVVAVGYISNGIPKTKYVINKFEESKLTNTLEDNADTEKARTFSTSKNANIPVEYDSSLEIPF
jgi:hypothetical protein